jgi:hypothetical protein
MSAPSVTRLRERRSSPGRVHSAPKTQFAEFAGEAVVAHAGDVVGDQAGQQVFEDREAIGASVGHELSPFGARGSREIW